MTEVTTEHEVIRIHGRCVTEGAAEADALVTTQAISGFGGTDPLTGTITERRHELRGRSFAGKVLVFPGAKGSSGWASNFQAARLAGAAPAAILFTRMNTKIALGAVVLRVPAMTDFDRDPIETIRTGDRVKVDATNGIVEIHRKGA